MTTVVNQAREYAIVEAVLGVEFVCPHNLQEFSQMLDNLANIN